MGSYELWALQSLAHLSPPPFELKFDSMIQAKMASLASLVQPIGGHLGAPQG